MVGGRPRTSQSPCYGDLPQEVAACAINLAGVTAFFWGADPSEISLHH